MKAVKTKKRRFGERVFSQARKVVAAEPEEIVAYGEVTYRADAEGIIEYRPGQYAQITDFHWAMQMLHGVAFVSPLVNNTFVVQVPLTKEQAATI